MVLIELTTDTPQVAHGNFERYFLGGLQYQTVLDCSQAIVCIGKVDRRLVIEHGYGDTAGEAPLLEVHAAQSHIIILCVEAGTEADESQEAGGFGVAFVGIGYAEFPGVFECYVVVGE